MKIALITLVVAILLTCSRRRIELKKLEEAWIRFYVERVRRTRRLYLCDEELIVIKGLGEEVEEETEIDSDSELIENLDKRATILLIEKIQGGE